KQVTKTNANRVHITNFLIGVGVYSIGVGFRDLLFENGEYLEEDEQSQSTRPEKNAKLKGWTGKSENQKKPVKASQARLLFGSHLLGFNEGYGDGLYPPCDVKIGKKQFIQSEKLNFSKSQGASTPAELKRMQNVPYALAVSSIIYAVRCPRLDVAFAQNVTSRFQQNPGKGVLTSLAGGLKRKRLEPMEGGSSPMLTGRRVALRDSLASAEEMGEIDPFLPADMDHV
nr:hypothetical protein [Tanacetum cinerariifolium]